MRDWRACDWRGFDEGGVEERIVCPVTSVSAAVRGEGARRGKVVESVGRGLVEEEERGGVVGLEADMVCNRRWFSVGVEEKLEVL